ncbi:MAG: TolC family protein [Gammaproteobacteria bacterium]|nr:TolC family protein [Gammaproteobacteria bacterium]
MFIPRGRVPVNISVLVIAASLWPTASAAAAAMPLTIVEAANLALTDEPGRASLQARAVAARERAVAEGRLPDPTMRVGLANFPVSSGGFSTEGMTQAQLGFRQAFPRARAAAAERFSAQAEAFGHDAEARGNDVLTAVRKAWLAAHLAQRSLALVDESRAYFEDLATVTRSLYSVGRKTQHDVLRAELELSRLEDRRIDAERMLSEARAALSRWIGADARRPIAMDLPDWHALPDRADLRAGLDRHPLLAAASATVDANDAAVRVAEQNKKPGWALDLGYGYRDGFLPDGQPRSDFVSLAVTVELPFLGRQRQDRKLAAALGDRRSAVNSRAELETRLGSELDAEFARWTDLTRRLALYESRILEQAQAQAEAALLAYQSDAGDFSDVMRARVDELDVRLEHIRLQVARARSYAVLANLGGLEP